MSGTCPVCPIVVNGPHYADLEEPRLSDDETYNGWTNWETWNTYNWLSSDPATYAAAHARAQRADALRELVELMTVESLPTSASLANDLLTRSLDRINWDELARAFTEDG